MADKPNRPAYDNPVHNKGKLAEGNNAIKVPRHKPSDQPQGHESDKGARPRTGKVIAPHQPSRTDISRPPLNGSVIVRKRCAGSLIKAK
jgi:hypothetical protein